AKFSGDFRWKAYEKALIRCRVDDGCERGFGAAAASSVSSSWLRQNKEARPIPFAVAIRRATGP
ncbi:MAG TPA: hypothetical protein VKG79_04650, partial [Bryobacteraceae bacterium]|nr:hypothetical protein [Bryobacteraceae bacterium]